ncbi:MAG: DCC1-like thiol-disulfide oxidoreductase family protein [Gemmatimonadaceae bacterium]
MTAIRNDAVMLYDGLCGFCDGTVQFILARDNRRTLRFAPLQGDFAQEFFERHPELRTIDSIILVEPATTDDAENISFHSDAIVLLAKYVGGIWRVFGVVLQIIPRFLRDRGYRTFARFRYRVFGRRDACRLPSADDRVRFLA